MQGAEAMTITLVKRPARIAAPQVSAEDVVIADPPKPQQTPPALTSLSMMIMPIIRGESFTTDRVLHDVGVAPVS